MAHQIPAKHRRKTPDHPPYALMIRAAIQSMAEAGGSSAESISAYIQANYDGLPWEHDKFFPYYLNKLTNIGEFVVAGGRYSLPVDEPILAEDTSASRSDLLRPSQQSNAGAMTDVIMRNGHETEQSLTRDSDKSTEPNDRGRNSDSMFSVLVENGNLDTTVGVSVDSAKARAEANSNDDDVSQFSFPKVDPPAEAVEWEPMDCGKGKQALIQTSDGSRDEPLLAEGGIVPHELVETESTTSIHKKYSGRPQMWALSDKIDDVLGGAKTSVQVGGAIVSSAPLGTELVTPLLLQSEGVENQINIEGPSNPKRRGRPPKRGFPKKGNEVQDELKTAELAGVTVPSTPVEVESFTSLLLKSSGAENQNIVEGSSKRGRRGRPPKRKLPDISDGNQNASTPMPLIGDTTSSVALGTDSTTALILQPNDAQNQNNVEGYLKIRRRGRPRKGASIALTLQPSDAQNQKNVESIECRLRPRNGSATAPILQPSDTMNQKSVEGSTKIERRGRPRKGSSTALILQPIDTRNEKNVEGSLKIERRGRPRKGSSTVFIPKPSDTWNQNNLEGSLKIERRGRPRKGTSTAVLSLPIDTRNQMSFEDSLKIKRRGRPRKATSQQIVTGMQPTSTSTVKLDQRYVDGSILFKRRGRPPKSEAQMKIAKAISAALKLKMGNVGSPLLKRRGRPPKKLHENNLLQIEAGENNLSLQLENNSLERTLLQNNVLQVPSGANNSSMPSENSLQLAVTPDAPPLPSGSENQSTVEGNLVP